MTLPVEIEQILAIEDYIDELTDLLIKVVADGASIGFLPPLPLSEARSYWSTVLNPDVLLFAALFNGKIAGTVQLHLAAKANGLHRAEIAKLMTDPQFRRLGIGRALMLKAEETAIRENRSLIVLDTRDGDPSNLLYTSLNYVTAGSIPAYALSADGELDATNLYYKRV